MILADMHIHSTFTDGQLSIPEIVDFYGVRGFGCIAITDHICEDFGLLGRAARYLNRTLTHATFPIYMAIIKSEAARAWKEYRMVVLPGFQLSKNSLFSRSSSHIIAIGTSEYVSADGDVVAIARAVRSQGGLAIAAHSASLRKFKHQPLGLWLRRTELAKEFDAWEVANGPIFFDEVKASGLPVLASSGFHKPKDINSWKTLLDCERDPAAILEAVRKQRLKFMFYREVPSATRSSHVPFLDDGYPPLNSGTGL